MMIRNIQLIVWMVIGLGLLIGELWFGIIWICSGYLIIEIEQRDIKEKNSQKTSKEEL